MASFKYYIVACFYWVFSHLWWFKKVNAPHPKSLRSPEIYAHWHGDELLLLRAYIGKGLAVMSSRSRDGQKMSQILRALGYFVTEGSSSRGGAGALIGLIQAIKKHGRDGALAVDGPRGPIYEVKPGVIKLAQKTGAPIVPVAGAASRRFIFEKAWNRSFVPLPFSRCRMIYGEPISVPKDLTEEELETYRLIVEQKLVALKADAERYFQRSFAVHNVQTAGV